MIRLGARVDNERFGQIGVDLIQQNLFSTGMRLGIRGYASTRIGEASVRFEIPRIANTLWTTLASRPMRHSAMSGSIALLLTKPLTATHANALVSFPEDRLGARLSAGRQLERNGVILAELRYEQQRYRDLNAAVVPGYQPLATVRGLARWDDRDDIYFPTEGPRDWTFSLSRPL